MEFEIDNKNNYNLIKKLHIYNDYFDCSTSLF